MDDDKRLHNAVVNMRTVTAGAAMVILSIILLFLSEKYREFNPIWIGVVVPSMAAVMATSGVFSLAYEVFVRREMTLFILRVLGIKQSVLGAGLTSITMNYMDYNYGQRILDASALKIYVLYASTWFSRYAVEIEAFLKKDGRSLTLCVPAFDNGFIAPLADRFGISVADFHHKIAEAVAECAFLAIKGKLGKKTTVKVYLHKSNPVYSMYHFGDVLLVGTYYSSSARRRAPMFELVKGPGGLFDDFDADYAKVCEDESECIFDSEAGINKLATALSGAMPERLKKALDKLAAAQAHPSPPAGS